jgi:hypothetical protein
MLLQGCCWCELSGSGATVGVSRGGGGCGGWADEVAVAGERIKGVGVTRARLMVVIIHERWVQGQVGQVGQVLCGWVRRRRMCGGVVMRGAEGGQLTQPTTLAATAQTC